MLVVVCLVVMAAASAADNFTFLAVGDWGGQDSSPYVTTGEVATASGMGIKAAEMNSRFQLALGDNFYSSGIHGTAESPRFEETFEECYNASSLNSPWYVIAGNHDHLGNVSAQIAYSQLSTRWNYPDYYYTTSHSFEDDGKNVTIDLIFIDTVLLAGNSDDAVTEENPHPQPPGPKDAKVAETQWQWLKDQMSASKADYLWVAGHYPVWSGCSHGPTQVLVDLLKPLLEQYKASGYLSGHDHCLEHMDEGKGPVYVLSGAGKECCYSDSKVDKNPKDVIKFIIANTGKGPVPIESGFASITHTAAGATIVYYAQNGTALYSPPVVAPRSF
eukprot:m.26786 g.26786  ORF g.26786 m.26786 type:complete len:331 (-) comp13821_c0_seq1:113-1105(-)